MHEVDESVARNRTTESFRKEGAAGLMFTEVMKGWFSTEVTKRDAFITAKGQ